MNDFITLSAIGTASASIQPSAAASASLPRRNTKSGCATRGALSRATIAVTKPCFCPSRSRSRRVLNRSMDWQPPTDGPKTLNGLLLERLERIPEPGTAMQIGAFQFEVLQNADNAIRTVRVRVLPRQPTKDSLSVAD